MYTFVCFYECFSMDTSVCAILHVASGVRLQALYEGES